MWGIDGKELKTSQSATQGLVARQLNKGRLEIKTDRGTVLSPYFNEDFLNGHNLKNAVLGKVYNDVSFPFIKESKESSTDKSMRQNIGYLTAQKRMQQTKICSLKEMLQQENIFFKVLKKECMDKLQRIIIM